MRLINTYFKCATDIDTQIPPVWTANNLFEWKSMSMFTVHTDMLITPKNQLIEWVYCPGLHVTNNPALLQPLFPGSDVKT